MLAIEKLGNPGWNWDAHLKYAKKSERYVASGTVEFRYTCCLTVLSRFVPPSAQEAEMERLHFNPAHHGTDGEQCVKYIYRPSLANGWAWIQAQSLAVTRRCVLAGILCTKKCVVLMPLHARLCWALISHDQTLENLGLPRTRDGVSAGLTLFEIPFAHHLVISGGRRCVYSRVAIHEEANCNPRVTALGWRLVRSIQKLKDVHMRWYVLPT